MIFLIIMVMVISVYEIRGIVKKQQKKEFLIFIVFAALSLILGIYYLSDPLRESLSQKILKLLSHQF